MLDKKLMSNCVSELMEEKNFSDEVKKTNKSKTIIKNLCDIKQCSNVALLCGVFSAGISSLCTVAGYISENPELYEQMGDITHDSLVLIGATLGVKYFSKFLTRRAIIDRANHEGKVLSYIRDKYINEKCKTNNIELNSEESFLVSESYDYDISDYAYDNKKEFSVDDFIKNDYSDVSEM